MTIYFAQGSDTGLVKIGFSRRTWDRLDQISAPGSDKLRLLRTCPGGRVAEQWVHRHLAEFRCHGEWFRFTPLVMSIEIPDHIQSDSDADVGFSPIKYDVNVEERILSALQGSYGHLRGADKMLAEDANVLPRTARNWLYGANMPGSVALIHMLAANESFRFSILDLITELSQHNSSLDIKEQVPA